jgi:hypothetical protein
VRSATAFTALAGDVHERTNFLRAQNDLRPRASSMSERCEKDIADLQTRVRPAS